MGARMETMFQAQGAVIGALATSVKGVRTGCDAGEALAAVQHTQAEALADVKRVQAEAAATLTQIRGRQLAAVGQIAEIAESVHAVQGAVDAFFDAWAGLYTKSATLEEAREEVCKGLEGEFDKHAAKLEALASAIGARLEKCATAGAVETLEKAVNGLGVRQDAAASACDKALEDMRAHFTSMPVDIGARIDRVGTCLDQLPSKAAIATLEAFHRQHKAAAEAIAPKLANLAASELELKAASEKHASCKQEVEKLQRRRLVLSSILEE
jgi:hypothetical protein